MARAKLTLEGWARADDGTWHYYTPNPALRAACGVKLSVASRLGMREEDQWHSAAVDCPECIAHMLLGYSLMVKPDALRWKKGEVA